ncbi:calcineurin-like phosphoesterase family protein [Thermosporothrix hazakensis]|jgi:predicted phosphodiesterase|uniref:Calcineurin-like phosphoesterase family protein n=1 Tax=Thermosporothrix hazakensis TaxID=644383 RepID=A0A326U8H7_THEHA|nr:metallophosphoesterase family protein [Thermosporothrix hazakensis]PZW31100.1 calcineurin-like phosphoesterase family protein [Thermosporothrix hazakensis]GCE50986.1 hypothetical protein KTH_58550 [Thermosporothrix hazakensis]
MKIGIFSDVHGNFVALQTVLAELEQVDRLLCLGDICALGPQPAEVIERLRQLQCPVILGNTDAWLEDPLLARESEAERHCIFYELALWSAEQLSESDHAFIRSLPSTLHVPLQQENSLLCFHGSPRSFDDVIAAVTPDDEVARMLQGQTATVMAGGHTHIQMVRRYQDSWILNCGAVGLPGVHAGSPELPQNPECLLGRVRNSAC